ncbi:MAG: alpha/beta hydrolase [Burkholderiales bacterium]
MNAGWIEANGASLRYELAGNNDGALVVLVHELGGQMESWDEVVPLLAPRFRLLRYDQRGCGLSEKVREGMTPISMASAVADLAALLDALAIKTPVHIAGSAIGAAITLGFAARHPARTKAIAVSSPAATGKLADAARAAMAERATIIRKAGMRAVVASSLDRSYPEALREKDRARFERYRARWLGNDPDGFIGSNGLSGHDLTQELANIRCPALVMGCVHDGLRPPAMTKAAATMIPGAEYLEVDSGHFMALQTPALFAEKVGAFFGRT